MIAIDCSCCGNKEGGIIYTGMTSIYSEKQRTLVQCNSCSNIITMPVPSADEIAEIYSSTYVYHVHLLALGEKKYRARKMASYIRNTFRSTQRLRVFEAGCMYGYLLQELKNDFDVKGIEIGKDAVDYCKSQGLDVEDSSVENFLSTATEKFDIIILSHVFEHLLEPSHILEKLGKCLKPNGRIIISVPNSGSINRKIFGRNWGWWQVPVHINHFNRNALMEISKRNNFSIDAIRYKGGDSLMLLLNFINLFHFRSKGDEKGFLQKTILKIFTSLLRFWYVIGNEEITVVLAK